MQRGGRTVTVGGGTRTSGSQQGSRTAKYQALAEQAHEEAEQSGGVHRERLNHPGNLKVLLFFLGVLAEAEGSSEGGGGYSDTWAQALRKAVRSLRDVSTRIVTLADLRALPYFGPATVRVAEVLWESHPPDGLTEEEARWKQDAEAHAQAVKDAEKARKAAERKAAKAAEKALLAAGATGPGAGPSLAALRPGAGVAAGAAALARAAGGHAAAIAALDGDLAAQGVPIAANRRQTPVLPPALAAAYQNEGGSQRGRGRGRGGGGRGRGGKGRTTGYAHEEEQRDYDTLAREPMLDPYDDPEYNPELGGLGGNTSGRHQGIGGDARAAKRKRLSGGGAAAGGGAEEGGGDGEEGEGGTKKKRKRTPKEYVPDVGTANYAFLVTLYISMKEGNDHETKATLMKKAEDSGLANKSLYGSGLGNIALAPGDRFYDGWSSLTKSLLNRTPPLVMAWSNPKKVKLTVPEGVRLAARMYKDAVARGKVAALPGVDPDTDINGPAGTEGTGQGASQLLPSQQQHPQGSPYLGSQNLGSQGSGGQLLGGGSAGAGPRAWAAAAERRAAAGAAGGAGAAGAGPSRLGVQQLTGRGTQQSGGQSAGGQKQTQRGSSKAAGGWNLVDGFGPVSEDEYGGGSDQEGAGAGGYQEYDPAWHEAGGVQHDDGDEEEEGWGAAGGSQGPSQRARGGGNARGAGLETQARQGGGGTDQAGPSQQRPTANNGGSSSADAIVIDDSSDDDEQPKHSARGTGAGSNSTGLVPPPAGGINAKAPAAAGVMGRATQPSGPSLGGSQGGGTGVGQQQQVPVITGRPPLPPGSRAAGPVAAARVGASQSQRDPAAADPSAAGPSQRGPSGGGAGGGGLPLSRQPSGGSQRSNGSGAGGGVAGGSTQGSQEGTMSRAGSQAIGQAYRWMLPRMSDMGPNGGQPPLRWPPLPPGATFAQVYEVVLVLDNREQFGRYRHGGHDVSAHGAGREVSAALLRAKGVSVEERALPIGDVTWVARARPGYPSLSGQEYVLDHVLERKSIRDLLASIQQGQKQRFQRQKWWLARCGLRTVLYLVEGDPDREALQPSDNKTVKTSCIGNELDGLRVVRSTNVNDTVAVLARITQAITRAYSDPSAPSLKPGPRQSGGGGGGAGGRSSGGGSTTTSNSNSSSQEGLPQYGDWASSVRRLQSSKTVKDVWGLMLCAVPGLGDQTVEAITNAYSTPQSLWDAYKQSIRTAMAAGKSGTAAARAMLSDLQLPSGAAKVGAVKAAKVYDLLFADNASL